MRVLFATSEISPWSKTGGLGDVAAALPRALLALGVDVRILVPGYPRTLDAFPDRVFVARFFHPGGQMAGGEIHAAETADGLPLWILHCPHYYYRLGTPYQDEHGHDWPDNYLRFGLLSRTAAWLASGASPLPWQPDVLHCHDWQTALAPAYLHYTLPRPAASVVTIHNIAFHGFFGVETLGPLGLPPRAFSIDGVEFHGGLCFLKAGLQLADAITTVSPTYAQEIQDPNFSFGLDGLLRHRATHLAGILNGIDTRGRDPSTDTLITRTFDAGHLDRKAENTIALRQLVGLADDPAAPLLSVISRLTHQKGLDLVLEIAPRLIAEGAQLVVLGNGERWMEDAFRELARAHPGRVAAKIGFDDTLGRQIEAGADIFLMPSRFEPCGLGQMYALRYGTPPVVRATGGLADTIVDCTDATLATGSANGFVFLDADAPQMLEATQRAIAAWRDKPRWRALQQSGMARDFSWTESAKRYQAVYETIAQRRHEAQALTR